jgi:hypothetical protein
MLNVDDNSQRTLMDAGIEPQQQLCVFPITVDIRPSLISIEQVIHGVQQRISGMIFSMFLTSARSNRQLSGLKTHTYYFPSSTLQWINLISLLYFLPKHLSNDKTKQKRPRGIFICYTASAR